MDDGPTHDSIDERDWLREHVLELRHSRWRADSVHMQRICRRALIAWLLLRHGADVTEAFIAVGTGEGAPPPGCR